MESTFLPCSKPLPPLPHLQVKSLHDLRLLTKVRLVEVSSLPVQYSLRHYEETVALQPAKFSQLAFWGDILVGTCTARLEPEGDTFRLYIMTLCVLKPYRRLGIASRLMEALLRGVYNETELRIAKVTLNVQTSSESAINFYKQFSFQQVEIVKDYYVNLDVNDAYRMELVIPQPNLIQGKKQGKKK